MKDFEKQLEKLAKDAAECELIAHLATDESKRKTFNDLASSYRDLGMKMKAAMASFKSMARANTPPDG
jgi:hypothetical protein